MAHNEDDKERFLAVLAETPLISYASKKSGISRATIYRLMKDDHRFKQKVQKALKIGRQNITDVAESALMKLIKDGHMPAIKFFLQHNSKRYSYSARPLEEDLEKERSAFMDRDGNIRVSKKTAELMQRLYGNDEAAKRRALGLPPKPL